MERLRVALVGCGIISESHLHAYQAHADRAWVVVCCDPDRAKAEALASQAGARVATDFRDVLDADDVDAIDILTPHHLHREQTVAALGAGKHVLLQKPLAHCLEDAEAILQAEREAKGVLYYAEMNRTTPGAIQAREAIAEGRIGQLIGTQASYSNWQSGDYLKTDWRYDPKVAGGGQLLDGGIHAIATMVTVAGRVESVSALTTRFRPELGGEDTAVVNFRYENGALGVLFSSHASGAWFPGPSFVAYGTEGLLAIGGPNALTLHRKDGKEVLVGERTNAFVEMVRHYLDVVQEGKPNPSPAELGLHEMKVVLSAYESAETGRTVRL